MPNIKIKTAEAALIMGCSPQFVRIGLQQGILDIGNAIKMSSIWTYNISAAALAKRQEHFEKEQRDKNWITSFVAVPYNNLYDRLFRLAEEYGKIKAEVYIDKTITDTIYVKVSKV